MLRKVHFCIYEMHARMTVQWECLVFKIYNLQIALYHKNAACVFFWDNSTNDHAGDQEAANYKKNHHFWFTVSSDYGPNQIIKFYMVLVSYNASWSSKELMSEICKSFRECVYFCFEILLTFKFYHYGQYFFMQPLQIT